MKKILFVLAILHTTYYILPPTAFAMCPVCTLAVGAGLGLSRWLGVDDTVSGVWVGGLILSSSLWLLNWLDKKYQFKSKFKYFNIPVIVLIYLIVLGPLTWTNIIGHPFNKLWGVDKLVIGIIIGSFAFLFGASLDKKVRALRGKPLFNFQKVVFPVALLLISSLILRLITM